MHHDDDDWDAEAAEAIFDALFWSNGRPNWFTVTLFVVGLGLAGGHCLG